MSARVVRPAAATGTTGGTGSGVSWRRPADQPSPSARMLSAPRTARNRRRARRETFTAEAQPAGSIRNRGCPYSTACPFSTRIFAMRPPTFASISFMSFIASMMQTICPSFTTSPSRT